MKYPAPRMSQTREVRLEAGTVTERERELAVQLLSAENKAGGQGGSGEYPHSFMGWVVQSKGKANVTQTQQQRILVVNEYRLTTLKKARFTLKGRSKLEVSKHLPFLQLRSLRSSLVDDDEEEEGASASGGSGEPQPAFELSFRQDDGSVYELRFLSGSAAAIIEPVLRHARAVQAALPAAMRFELDLHHSHVGARARAATVSAADAFLSALAAIFERDVGAPPDAHLLEHISGCFAGEDGGGGGIGRARLALLPTPFATPRLQPYSLELHGARRLHRGCTLDLNRALALLLRERNAAVAAAAKSKGAKWAGASARALVDAEVEALATALRHCAHFEVVALEAVVLGSKAAAALFRAAFGGQMAPRLVSLSLRSLGLAGAALAPLPALLAAPAAKELRLSHLDLSGNPLGSGGGSGGGGGAALLCEAVAALKPTLRFLSLAACSLTKPATRKLLAEALAGTPLVRLNLTRNAVSSTALARWLALNQVLTHLLTSCFLDLLRVAFTTNSLLVSLLLLYVLPNQGSLRELHAAACGGLQTRLVCEAVRANGSLLAQQTRISGGGLQSLNLAGNAIGANGGGGSAAAARAAAAEVGQLVARAASLDWLQLAGMRLGNGHLTSILEGWSTNAAAGADQLADQMLVLAGNDFSGGGGGGGGLGSAKASLSRRPWRLLPACTSIAVLDVSDCRIGAAGMVDLVTALAACDSVRVLRASRNVPLRYPLTY